MLCRRHRLIGIGRAMTRLAVYSAIAASSLLHLRSTVEPRWRRRVLRSRHIAAGAYFGAAGARHADDAAPRDVENYIIGGDRETAVIRVDVHGDNRLPPKFISSVKRRRYCR